MTLSGVQETVFQPSKIDFVVIWLMFFLQVVEVIGLLAVHTDDKEHLQYCTIELKVRRSKSFLLFFIKFSSFLSYQTLKICMGIDIGKPQLDLNFGWGPMSILML